MSVILDNLFRKKIRQKNIINRKGQLKIQQMVFMLLAITLFFILAGLFYLSIKIVSLEQDAFDLNRDKASALIEKIASNPEFLFEDIPNAIDADKLMILKDEVVYRNFFGIEGIIVQKIYPVEDDVECTLENYPHCSVIKLFTDKDFSQTQSFVSWCSKKSISSTSYSECSLAILMVEEKEINVINENEE